MFPTTDQGRIDHLQLILTMTRLDLHHGHPVMHDTYTRVEACHDALSDQLQSVFDTEHLLAIRRKPFLDALHGLIHLCRDFWLLQQRLARREGTLSRLLCFREPGQNPLPMGSRADAWLGFASRLIDGERAAIEAGYTPLLQPDVATLSSALNRAESLQKPYLHARAQLRDVRRVLARVRADADLALRGQAFALRWLYRDRELLARAQRRYGFRRKTEVQATKAAQADQAPDQAQSLEAKPFRAVGPLPALHLVPFALSGLQAAVTTTGEPIPTYSAPVQTDATHASSLPPGSRARAP